MKISVPAFSDITSWLVCVTVTPALEVVLYYLVVSSILPRVKFRSLQQVKFRSD